MLHYVDLEWLDANSSVLRDDFAKGTPFKHLNVDKLVSPDKAVKLAQSFPESGWGNWSNRSNEHQYLKSSCRDVSLIPEELRTVIYELNSGPFLSWLSKVTGIDSLLPDPNLIGGGLHLTGPGGTLTPHTDFHVVEGLPLYRRINLLIYLNPDWKTGDGGELELWNSDGSTIAKLVPPTLGTTVIFQTDDDSVHGFTNPVANEYRRSIAMYYYTAEDADKFSGDGSTYWRPVSVSSSAKDRFSLMFQRFCLFLARVFSSLSWRISKIALKTRR